MKQYFNVYGSKLEFSLTIFWPAVWHSLFQNCVAIVFPNSPPTSNFLCSCFPSTGRQRLERRSIRPMPYLRERPTHAGNSCFQLQSHEKWIRKISHLLSSPRGKTSPYRSWRYGRSTEKKRREEQDSHSKTAVASKGAGAKGAWTARATTWTIKGPFKDARRFEKEQVHRSSNSSTVWTWRKVFKDARPTDGKGTRQEMRGRPGKKTSTGCYI